MSVLGIIVTASLAQNVVLVHFLGLWPFPAVVHSPKQSALISVCVTVALLWVAVVFWLISRWVLVPLDLAVLETVTLAAVMGLSALGGIRLGGQIAPFHQRLVRQLVPVVMVNMTVFVVTMGLVHQAESLQQVVAGAVAAGFGLLLAVVPISAVRVHFTTANVPRLLRGDVSVYLATSVMAFAIQQIDQILQPFLVPLF